MAKGKIKSTRTAEIRSINSSTEQIVYMGPGVPASGLYRGRVFKGPLPAEVDKILKENPWMKDLFVEPKDVAKAQQDLTIKSTLIHKLAGKVIEMRGGSGA